MVREHKLLLFSTRLIVAVYDSEHLLNTRTFTMWRLLSAQFFFSHAQLAFVMLLYNSAIDGTHKLQTYIATAPASYSMRGQSRFKECLSGLSIMSCKLED